MFVQKSKAMKDDIIVGLDVGTTKIACIVGRRNENGKVEILGHGKAESIGVKRGVVSNIEDTVKSIKAAVEEASNRSNVEIKTVHVGIAGQHIKSYQHRGSLIRESRDIEITNLEVDKLINDMYKLNMAPGEDIIDVIPQEYIVDDESGIKQPIGMQGSKLEANFHVIIGQTSAITNLCKCVERAGLEVADLILEPIASSAAVLGKDENEAGVVLVDIGGGTTDVAIFYDTVIRHTAVIPFGGNIITEDIREGCTIIKKHAEEVKVKFGSALASENRSDEVVSIPGIRGRAAKEISFYNLASIIQARLEEIFEQIYSEIKNSGYERKLIAGIVLTGGGALMKHIDQLASFTTGLDVRIGYSDEHLAPGYDEVASPMYATSVGLVIEGMRRHDLEEELERLKVPDKEPGDLSYVKKKQRKDKSHSYLDRIKNFFDKGLIE